MESHPARVALPSIAPAPHHPAGIVADVAPPLSQIVCEEIR
jgi:hypothetical protein